MCIISFVNKKLNVIWIMVKFYIGRYNYIYVLLYSIVVLKERYFCSFYLERVYFLRFLCSRMVVNVFI